MNVLQSSADGPIPQDPGQKKLVFCNAKGVTYLNNDDLIPAGSQFGEPVCKLIEIKIYIWLFQSSAGIKGLWLTLASAKWNQPNGVFFQPGKYDEDGAQVYTQMTIAAQPGGVPKVEDTICTKGALATVNRYSGRVFFCFDAISQYELQPTAKPAPQQYLKLDYFYSGSRLLIHELVHLWHPSKSSRW